jgi:hypothetical protein
MGHYTHPIKTSFSKPSSFTLTLPKTFRCDPVCVEESTYNTGMVSVNSKTLAL